MMDRPLLWLLLMASAFGLGCGARSQLLDGDEAPPEDARPGETAGCDLPEESPAVCPTGTATLVDDRSPITVRTDATHVVYTTSSGGPAGSVSLLEAAPLAGGPHATLYTFAENANPFAWTLRGGAVYLNDGQGHILRIEVDGSGQSTLYTSPSLPFRAWHFAADEEWLFFGERSNKAGTERLSRLPLTGGTREILAELTFTWEYTTDFSPNQHVEVSVDDCSLYWLHEPTVPKNGGTNFDGTIYRVAKSGGAPMPLLEDLARPGQLSRSRDAAWVIDDGDIPFSTEQRLMGVGNDGGARAPLSFGTESVALLVLDESAVHYVLYGPPGDLNAKTGWWTRPLDDSAPPSLIPTAPVSPEGVYVASLDRTCRMLYSSVANDIVRQPLP